jgi:hypothetical protein
MKFRVHISLTEQSIDSRTLGRLLDFVRLTDLQALYELGYADDYRLRPKELAEAQAMRGMNWPELP